jgi:hypothetical protein
MKVYRPLVKETFDDNETTGAAPFGGDRCKAARRGSDAERGQASAVLLEISDDRETERAYLNMEVVGDHIP